MSTLTWTSLCVWARNVIFAANRAYMHAIQPSLAVDIHSVCDMHAIVYAIRSCAQRMQLCAICMTKHVCVCMCGHHTMWSGGAYLSQGFLTRITILPPACIFSETLCALPMSRSSCTLSMAGLIIPSCLFIRRTGTQCGVRQGTLRSYVCVHTHIAGIIVSSRWTQTDRQTNR